MRYPYLFFDLDGTLTDPGEGIMNSVRYALERLGYPIPDTATLRAFIGPPLSFSFVHFCGMTEAEAQEAIVHYRQYFAPRGMLENRLIPGVPAMLSKLQDAGCCLFLSTSKPEVFAKQILDRFDLSRYFSFVAGSLLDGGRSEKAAVISHAMAAKALSSSDGCLMIGDRLHDVEGAASCSMPCLGVLYGYGSAEELTAAGAVALAVQPEDVVSFVLS